MKRFATYKLGQFDKFMPDHIGKREAEFKNKFNNFFMNHDNQMAFDVNLKNLLEKFKEDHSTRQISRYAHLQSTPSFKKIASFTATDLSHFLLKRILAVYLLFCQRMNIDQTRDILLERNGQAEEASKLSYFIQKLHIYVTNAMAIDELSQLVNSYILSPEHHTMTSRELRIVKRLVDALSPFERQVIITFQSVKEKGASVEVNAI